VVQADAELRETAAAKAAWTTLQIARRTTEAMERAWAGARIAGVFRQWPWLAALKVSLYPESTYDDQGGNYRTVSVMVSGLETVAEAQLPELLNDSEFDLDVAADILQDELQDDAGSLYSALMDDDSYEDFDLSVRREQLGRLLERPEVDGAEVLAALFPEEVTVDVEAGAADGQPSAECSLA